MNSSAEESRPNHPGETMSHNQPARRRLSCFSDGQDRLWTKRKAEASRKLSRIVVGVLCAAVTTFAVTAPVNAEAPLAPPPEHDPVVGFEIEEIVEETLGKQGEVVSTVVTSGDSVTRASSSSGGVSRASGCTKVTIRNRARTLLGHTAYRYNIWTSWCWNRSARTVSSVRADWYLSDVDGNFIYREELVRRTSHFSWLYGHPSSGYEHARQARIENCVFKYGCISSTYPHNVLYSYSDGTYRWWIDI